MLAVPAHSKHIKETNKPTYIYNYIIEYNIIEL